MMVVARVSRTAQQSFELCHHLVQPGADRRDHDCPLRAKGPEIVTALAELKNRFERIAIINEASSMLGWDSSVMMPLGGAAARGDQLAVLAGLSHQLLTDLATGEWLAAASAPADEWEAANLRLIRRAHVRATALPGELVEAQSRANSK